MSRNAEKSEQIKRQILEVVGRFGWLRMKEISRYVWSETPEQLAITYAFKFIKKLEQNDYVFLHTLKKKQGTVVILKRKAINFLRDLNVIVTKTDYKTWQPDRDFEHDVLTQSLFVTLAADKELTDDSMFYLTDRECRRATLESTNEIREWHGERKVPDLIIKTKNGILAIEVERCEKRGHKNKKAIIETLTYTNVKEAPYTYNGIKVDAVAIAYDPYQKLMRKRDGELKIRSIDNAKNIFNTSKKVLKDFKITEMRSVLFKLQVEHGAVVSYTYIDEVVSVERMDKFYSENPEQYKLDFDEVDDSISQEAKEYDDEEPPEHQSAEEMIAAGELYDQLAREEEERQKKSAF